MAPLRNAAAIAKSLPWRPLRDRAAVDVEAADLRVHVEELVGADLAAQERPQPVLDAHVADGEVRETAADLALLRAPLGLGPRAEDVDHVVPEGAAGATRVRRRVVALGGRQPAAGIGRIGDALEQPLVGGDRVDRGEMAVHPRHLRRQPDHSGRPVAGVLEVAAQAVVVGELESRAQRVRVRAAHHEALVDAGVGVGDLLRRHGSARAADADGVPDLAVLLGQPLLGHQQGLGLGDDVAVVLVVVERSGHDGEPARESGAGRIVERGQRPQRRRAGAVRHAAAEAVGGEHLPVPLLLRVGRRPALAGLEQGDDLVLVAILVAGLLAHDEGDAHALVGRRRVDVVRRLRRVVRGEATALARLVEEAVLRRFVALLVAGGLLAAPRLDLRAREHGAAVGMVGDGQLGAPAVGQAGGQHVPADAQAADEADQPARADAREGLRDVAAAARHLGVPAARAGGQVERDQRIAAGCQVGARRQDRQPGRRLLLRLGGGRGDGCHGEHGRGESESLPHAAASVLARTRSRSG